MRITLELDKFIEVHVSTSVYVVHQLGMYAGMMLVTGVRACKQVGIFYINRQVVRRL